MPWIYACVKGQFELVHVADSRVPALNEQGFIDLPPGVYDDEFTAAVHDLAASLKAADELEEFSNDPPANVASENADDEPKSLSPGAGPNGRPAADVATLLGPRLAGRLVRRIVRRHDDVPF